MTNGIHLRIMVDHFSSSLDLWVTNLIHLRLMEEELHPCGPIDDELDPYWILGSCLTHLIHIGSMGDELYLSWTCK